MQAQSQQPAVGRLDAALEVRSEATDHDLQNIAPMKFSFEKPVLERPEIFPQKSPEIEPPTRQDPEIDEPPRRQSPEIMPEPSPDATPPQPSRSPEIIPPGHPIQPMREPIPTPVHPET